MVYVYPWPMVGKLKNWFWPLTEVLRFWNFQKTGTRGFLISKLLKEPRTKGFEQNQRTAQNWNRPQQLSGQFLGVKSTVLKNQRTDPDIPLLWLTSQVRARPARFGMWSMSDATTVSSCSPTLHMSQLLQPWFLACKQQLLLRINCYKDQQKGIKHDPSHFIAI
jgi:hypothetical protein